MIEYKFDYDAGSGSKPYEFGHKATLRRGDSITLNDGTKLYITSSFDVVLPATDAKVLLTVSGIEPTPALDAKIVVLQNLVTDLTTKVTAVNTSIGISNGHLQTIADA